MNDSFHILVVKQNPSPLLLPVLSVSSTLVELETLREGNADGTGGQPEFPNQPSVIPFRAVGLATVRPTVQSLELRTKERRHSP